MTNVSSNGNSYLVTETRRVSIIDTAKDTGHWCQRKYRQIFRKKMLFKRVPILNWLPKYRGGDAVGDLIAGITVGLTVIPQALAYSGIAGLDPQVRIFSSIIFVEYVKVTTILFSVWIVRVIFGLFHLYHSWFR